MLDVDTWIVFDGTPVTKRQGHLIECEMIRDPRVTPYLMEVTQELGDVAKENVIFYLNLKGTMTPDAYKRY